MPNSKFPKLLDYDALKQQFGEDESPPTQYGHTQVTQETDDALDFDEENQPKPTGLTGSRLRSYAFAVLTRKEYSKAELIEKLATWAMHREEVITLVEELSAENYQSDQPVQPLKIQSVR
jgi:regulatory protein